MTSQQLVVAYTTRDVVAVTGPEALSFVHSQISQDIEDIAVGESRWSFVLQPQGKVDGLFRVTRTGDDSLLLDTEAGQGQSLEDSIGRFKLRTKAEFSTSSTDMAMLRGPGAAVMADNLTAATVLPAPWTDDDAVDVLSDETKLDVAVSIRSVLIGAVSVSEVSAEEFERLRMQHGMPAIGTDIDKSTIPNETGLLDLAVSFTKGCYRGQELVERINSRGGNRRLLHRLSTTDGSPLSAGAAIVAADREVGSATSASGAFGFGYIRGDTDIDSPLTADGVSITASTLF